MTLPTTTITWERKYFVKLRDNSLMVFEFFPPFPGISRLVHFSRMKVMLVIIQRNYMLEEKSASYTKEWGVLVVCVFHPTLDGHDIQTFYALNCWLIGFFKCTVTQSMYSVEETNSSGSYYNVRKKKASRRWLMKYAFLVIQMGDAINWFTTLCFTT